MAGTSGNGSSVLVVSLDGSLTLAGAAVLVVPQAVADGSVPAGRGVGGLLTPALATGAATGR